MKNKRIKKKIVQPKPDWGNPFYNQQRASRQIIGGKRGFSGASRKGMGGK